MTDRAQLSSSHARPIAMFLIGLTVIGLVGREIVAAQRAALAECAPDCQLGAPLFAHVGTVEAVVVVGVLLVAAVVPVVVRRRWGERDG